jgi:hypothetical protein
MHHKYGVSSQKYAIRWCGVTKGDKSLYFARRMTGLSDAGLHSPPRTPDKVILAKKKKAASTILIVEAAHSTKPKTKSPSHALRYFGVLSV